MKEIRLRVQQRHVGRIDNCWICIEINKYGHVGDLYTIFQMQTTNEVPSLMKTRTERISPAHLLCASNIVLAKI